MSRHRILSVGQCGPDHASINSMLQRHFQASVDPAQTVTDAIARITSNAYDLVLVNRVFDYDSTSGIEFIRDLRANPALISMPIMLVSNLPEAQAEAIAAGAIQGFGKSSLSSPETLTKLRKVLATASGAPGE